MGVVKAYTTRVGEGPFPTELLDDDGPAAARRRQRVRAVTGRPRRCGWFDAVALRYAVRVNGLDALAITKLDVLDGFSTLKVCTAYTADGETVEHFPSEIGQLARCEPVYRDVPGWTAPTAGVKRFEDLPAEARAYVATLEEICGVPVGLISTGSDRLDTILRHDTIAARWFTLPA